jgi:hypothetical protein
MCAECSRRCFLVRGTGAAAGLILGGLGFIGCNNQSGKGAEGKMASEMIAYCGLNCITCPIYLATREKNPEERRRKREQIVIAIRKYLGEEKRVEDITDCDGCKAQSGRLYSDCQKCRIRKCARQKRLENCAYCRQYPCEKLTRFFDSEDIDGGARKRLDAIKAQL